MRLRTFGELSLEGSCHFNPKHVLLLAYLVSQGERGEARDNLGLLFYSTVTTASKRHNNLRHAVSKLYKPELIFKRQQRIYANPQLEADEPRLLQALQNHDAITVASLYQGDFLADIESQPHAQYLQEREGSGLMEWIDERRHYFRSQVSECFLRHAETLLAQGDSDQARLYAERALQLHNFDIDPYDAQQHAFRHWLERFQRVLIACGSTALQNSLHMLLPEQPELLLLPPDALPVNNAPTNPTPASSAAEHAKVIENSAANTSANRAMPALLSAADKHTAQHSHLVAANSTANHHSSSASSYADQGNPPSRSSTRNIVGSLETSRTVHFCGRVDEKQRLLEALCHPEIKLVQLLARGGMGKTALVTQALCELAQDADSPGILYLRLQPEDAADTPVLETLLTLLLRLLPHKGDSLRRHWQRSHLSLAAKLEYLFHQLLSEKPIVVVLDNVENVLDDNNRIIPAALTAFVRAFVECQHHATLLLSSRYPLLSEEACRLQHARRILELPPLSEANSLQLLRARLPAGHAAQIPSDSLRALAQHSHGIPGLLDALLNHLERCPTLPLTSLEPAPAWLQTLLQHPSQALFDSLEHNAQAVMKVLALYHAPVPHSAIQHFLPQLPAETLDALTRNRLVHYDMASACFQLHSLDCAVALLQLQQDLALGTYSFADVQAMHAHAAGFYKTQAPPRSQQQLATLEPCLRAFEHLIAAERYDDATEWLLHINHQELYSNFRFEQVIRLHDKVYGKVRDPFLAARHLNAWGIAHMNLGNFDVAREAFREALRLCGQVSGVPSEHTKVLWGHCYGNIGICSARMGDVAKAIEIHQQSRSMALEDNDMQSLPLDCYYLGVAYLSAGDISKAKRSFEEALLLIAHSQLDFARREEGMLHNAMAEVYLEQKHYPQALQHANIALELGTKHAEIRVQIEAQLKRAQALLKLMQLETAEQAAKHAQAQSLSVGYNNAHMESLRLLAEIRFWLEEQSSQALRNSYSYIEQAFQLARQLENRNEEALCMYVVARLLSEVKRYPEAMLLAWRARQLPQQPQPRFTQALDRLMQQLNERTLARLDPLGEQVLQDCLSGKRPSNHSAVLLG